MDVCMYVCMYVYVCKMKLVCRRKTTFRCCMEVERTFYSHAKCP